METSSTLGGKSCTDEDTDIASTNYLIVTWFKRIPLYIEGYGHGLCLDWLYHFCGFFFSDALLHLCILLHAFSSIDFYHSCGFYSCGIGCFGPNSFPGMSEKAFPCHLFRVICKSI